MGWGEYARSKVPLKLVFISFAAIAVNLLLIFGFQLLTQYRYTAPIDEQTLSDMNSTYENCTILTTSTYTDPVLYTGTEYTAFLLELQDGTTSLAVVSQHPFVARIRYEKKLSMPVPQVEGIQDLYMGSALFGGQIRITDNTRTESLHVLNNGPGIPLALIPMIIVEYIAYCWFFKRDELL